MMMGFYDMGFYTITIILSLVGMVVSGILKSKFAKYSRYRLSKRLTGYEIARNMLDYYGLPDVKILEGKGRLTDHYNPLKRTVTLSPEVYRGNSVAASAVAAHECGHAVQHKEAYAMLKLRSAIVPVVSFAARAQQFLLIAAFVFLQSFPQLMLITIVSFLITTLFAFITLPVEFDASKRALYWLSDTGVLQEEEYRAAKDALFWAAMTYVAAALSALVMVVYLMSKYNSSRD